MYTHENILNISIMIAEWQLKEYGKGLSKLAPARAGAGRMQALRPWDSLFWAYISRCDGGRHHSAQGEEMAGKSAGRFPRILQQLCTRSWRVRPPIEAASLATHPFVIHKGVVVKNQPKSWKVTYCIRLIILPFICPVHLPGRSRYQFVELTPCART